MQKNYRGYRIRKNDIGKIVTTEIECLKSFYKIIKTFRRKIKLRNVLSGLRKNVLLSEYNRQNEEQEFIMKRCFSQFLIFNKRTEKEKNAVLQGIYHNIKEKAKKGLYSLQSYSAKNILQKNILYESVIYHNNLRLTAALFSLMTKKQKLKKLLQTEKKNGNEVKKKMKEIMQSKKYNNYNNTNYDKDHYNNNNLYPKNVHNSFLSPIKENTHKIEIFEIFEKNEYSEQEIKSIKNVRKSYQNIRLDPGSDSTENVHKSNLLYARKENLKFLTEKIKRNFYFSEISRPQRENFLIKKVFQNLICRKDYSKFFRSFLDCCERYWAFPYFQYFFELMKNKKKQYFIMGKENEKMKFVNLFRVFDSWNSFTKIRKEDRNVLTQAKGVRSGRGAYHFFSTLQVKNEIRKTNTKIILLSVSHAIKKKLNRSFFTFICKVRKIKKFSTYEKVADNHFIVKAKNMRITQLQYGIDKLRNNRNLNFALNRSKIRLICIRRLKVRCTQVFFFSSTICFYYFSFFVNIF